jgi:phage-related protein
MASRGQVQIDVVADTSKFAAQLQRDLKAALKTVKVKPKVEVDPDTAAEAERVAEKLRLELKAALDRIDVKANVNTKLDSNSATKSARVAGQRIGQSFSAGLLKSLGSIGNVITKSLTSVFSILATVSKWALLAAVLAQTAVAASHFIGALLPAAGIVAALPAVLLASVAALGVLKLALRGVGDALKAGFSGDAQKFADALKGLAPAAQTAVKAIVSLKPALDNLGKAVQGAFFAGFTEQIKALATLYLPLLQKQLPPIATALGAFAVKLGLAARTPAVVGAINAALASTARALASASGGTQSLVTGFALASQVGLPLVEGLGIAVGVLSQRFGDFLTQASKSGQLENFITGALGVFHQLGDVLSNVGQIALTVFAVSSSGGGSLLTTLVNVTGAMVTFLQSAKGIQDLRTIFSSLAEVGRALASTLVVVLPILGNAIATIAPSIGFLAVALGGVIQAIAPLISLVALLISSIGGQLAAALVTLTPLIQSVAIVLSAGLGKVLPIIAGALLSLFEAVAPVLQILASLATTIGGQLAATLTIIAPLIGKAALALGGALASVLPTIVGAFLKLVEALAPLLPIVTSVITLIAGQLATALSVVAPIIATVANVLIGSLGRVLPLVTKAILDLIVALAPLLIPIAQLIAQLLDGLIPALVPLIPALVQVALAVAGPLVTALGELVPSLIKIVGIIAPSLLPLLPVLADAFSKILIAVLPLIPPLLSLLDALWPLIPPLVQLVTSIITLVLPALIALVTIVVYVFSTMINAALPVINAIVGAITWLVGKLNELIGWLTKAFAAAGKWASDLPDAIKGIPGKITGALGDLGNLLTSAGGKIIQGLIDGIKSKFGDLKNTMSNAVQGIRDYLPFSPAKTGPLSGDGSPEHSGIRIAEGVAEGIDKRRADLQRAMASMTSGLTVAAPPVDLGGAVQGGDGAAAGQQPGGLRVWPNQPKGDAKTLTLVADGSKMSALLVEVISKAVRLQGGDVQKVLGKNPGGVQ